MSLFDRFRQRGKPAGRGPSAETAAQLTEFITTHDGVEAFIEPPTNVYAMSVCLVASDGEYLRRPVKDDAQARRLCREHNIPLYDARIVGYPKRMREYERGQRATGIRLEDLPPLDVTDEPGTRDD